MKRINKKLCIFFILAFPLVSMAAEPAWWTQQKQKCGLSPGLAYNTWVSQGSPCNSGGSSSSSSATSSGGSIGTIIGTEIGKVISDALFGNPEADARRKAEEGLRAEQQRRQEEETLKRHEEMKNRLLGGMMGVDSSPPLGLMDVGSGPELSLMTDDLQVGETSGAFGKKELKLIMGDEVAGARKLSEGPEKYSDRARKGFDTAGKIMKSDLPAAPPAPMGKPVSPIKLEKINVLKTTLKKNEDEEKALKAQLEKLRQSPEPDETAMKDLQEKITVKKDEKEKIEKEMQDLTAEDPDEPASNQSSTNISTGVK